MPFILYGHNIILNVSSVDNEIVVYPNPSSGFFKVETSNPCDILISDITGKIIYQKDNYFNETINLSNNTPGVYIIKIIENNIQTTKKLLIK